MHMSSTVALFPVTSTPAGADKVGATNSLSPEVNDSDILFLDGCNAVSAFFCLNTTECPGGTRLVCDTGMVLSKGGESVIISASTVTVGWVGSDWEGKASLVSDGDWAGVLDVEMEADIMVVVVSCRTGTQPSSSSRSAPWRVREIRHSA